MSFGPDFPNYTPKRKESRGEKVMRYASAIEDLARMAKFSITQDEAESVANFALMVMDNISPQDEKALAKLVAEMVKTYLHA